MLYEYVCPGGHVTEKRGGLGDVRAPCSQCNRLSQRRGFNFVSIGTKEKKYRVSDFIEASSEIDHAYSTVEKTEGKSVKRPNLYKRGLAEAHRRDPKVRT